MQTVNISLMWWLAHGATVPEAVVVYDYLLSPDKNAMCRRALGPEVWVARAEMDAKGSWLGPVAPPLLTRGAAQEVEELPPPPAEVIVPVYADTLPDTLPVASNEVESAAVESAAVEPESTNPPCPPEVEALLGKEKDTVVAAQYGLSVSTVTEWRKERGIVRFRTKVTSDNDTESNGTESNGTESNGTESNGTDEPFLPRTATDESALSDIVAHRFADGASDEDMAQEAGVSVAKVVNARLALGLIRPRGRKPGVPQKRVSPSEETSGSTATDDELDALLSEAV